MQLIRCLNSLGYYIIYEFIKIEETLYLKGIIEFLISNSKIDLCAAS